jgi:CRP-like cAMP-binding protein
LVHTGAVDVGRHHDPPMPEIRLFQNATDSVSLEPGDELFREGDAGDVMYAVVEGDLEVLHAQRVIEHVGPGGIIGEMALIDAEPRSATVRATSATRVVPVDATQFTRLVHNHPTFALQVMAVMAERLRHSNDPVGADQQPRA